VAQNGRLLLQTAVSSQPYQPIAQAGKIGPAVCPEPVETAVYPQPTNHSGAAMKEHAFQVAINQKYRDKVKPGNGRFWKFNMTFQTTHLTLPMLLAIMGTPDWGRGNGRFCVTITVQDLVQEVDTTLICTRDNFAHFITVRFSRSLPD
jgi:hypothetical protein